MLRTAVPLLILLSAAGVQAQSYGASAAVTVSEDVAADAEAAEEGASAEAKAGAPAEAEAEADAPADGATVEAATSKTAPSGGPALPSGLDISPVDAQIEEQPGGELWLVLRYLAPSIADNAVDYSSVVPDLDHLCASEGLPRVSSAEVEIAQIVVILMDRPLERGAPDPEATQYIGAYLPVDGACQWQ